MLLGTMMSALRDEDVATATLMELGDIVLAAQVEAARDAHGESVGEYVSGAVQRFALSAGDEDWLGLMTALERSDDPAGACLTRMLSWSLARDARAHPGNAHDGCSCGGGGCHDHS
ncbi:MAG: hypothetical protein F9K19_21240 [Rhizobiaceae bacterium]|nr:MAG: hypothetical protein F9K19_21240 [Rhizobiaceae bacterium]CAG0983718.1 hypothetical protein RHIZO_01875 [Rhizobiaceae bacterium]